MNILLYFSELAIPLTAAYIIAYGLVSKRNVFDDFTKGAENGLKTTIELIPTLIGLLMAVRVLRSSGLLDFLCSLLGKLIHLLGMADFPEELLPLAIVKLFSASAANGLLFDIFKEYSTDSFFGLAASIMMSCSETMLYCLSIYFGSIKITKARWSIAGSLIAIISGMIVSLLLANAICT